MDWLGIGVLLIGIAFLVLVIFLLKPLSKLSDVLESVQKTTDQLPETLTDITGQAATVLHTSNETIGNVNNQVKEISPIFQIAGDVGVAARELSSATLDKTMTFKQNTSGAKDLSQRKKYAGLYGLLSILFYFSQKKDEIKRALPNPKLK